MIIIFYTIAILTGVGLIGIWLWFEREKHLTKQALEDEIRLTAIKLGVDLTEVS